MGVRNARRSSVSALNSPQAFQSIREAENLFSNSEGAIKADVRWARA